MASSTETLPKEYRKRPGTSGIRGHLYETKLLSLIHFRAIHDERIEEFHLATNVDKLGSFDDICFRAKLRGIDKPLAVFIQAKHREKNSVLTLNSRSDLLVHFNSYLEIKRQFKPNNTDVLFDGTFSETECLFVIYTTAKGDQLTSKYEGMFSEPLNALIGTGDPGSQPMHGFNNEELYEIVLKDQITALARLMAKFIFGKFCDIQMLMQSDLVLRFHVILARKVFDVSEDQSEGHRIARFRQDFFYANEKFLQLFKDELCTEILKIRKLDSGHLSCFVNRLRYIDDDVLIPVNKKNEIYIIYKNRKFSLDTIGSHRETWYLDENNESQHITNTILELVVKDCLPSLEFKVPASFGNKDLTIKGGDKRHERKLNDLSSKIVGLIKQSILSNIVLIDESMGEGFLQLSGGIASAVGNLLVFDDVTKLMKFNDNYESLGKLAKKLFDKLHVEIENLHEYKFDVQVKIFPKLSFDVDEYSKKIVSDFFKNFVFYTSQSYEKDVEKALIFEINNSQSDDVPNVEITSDAIFLKYHDEIQKWWMTPKVGRYLTKEGSLYKNAVKYTSSQPLISVLNMMCKIKIKNLTLNEDAVNSMNINDLPSGTIVVTANSALTVAKLKKQLNCINCVVLDLEYILNLSPRDDQTLRKELMNTNEVKSVIIVFDNALITTRSTKRIENIANSIKDKTVIIIAAQNSVENVKNYFSFNENVVNLVKDERSNLIDMSDESQKSILEDTKVIFQGDEVSLVQFLDVKSIGYVGGDVLFKIMNSSKNIIGKPVSYSDYIPKLYIERTVICGDRIQTPAILERKFESKWRGCFKTLFDIRDNVALITGDPGIGKSTLLTHLSLNTKEHDPTLVWILRINLLEHSKQFFEWQENKSDIDTLESLKFLCQVALSEESSKKKNVEITLEEYNYKMCLKDCTGDEWTVFELKMFLHYYNTKKIVILLDGFDEICPTYAHEVLKLIEAIKMFSPSHKLLITSRSYDKIITILELRMLKLYEVEPLDNDQQTRYLTEFWDEKKILEDLEDVHIRNICEFVTFFKTQSEKLIDQMKKNNLRIQSKKELPFLAVYLSLVKYLKSKSMIHDSVSNMFASYSHDSFENISTLELNGFVASPLHLKLVADYLYDQIRECYKKSKWDFDMHIFDIFEGFVETKLKRIRFQEKNQIDMYKPDNIAHYNRVYAEFKDKHKKLAAYGLYYRSRTKLFDEDELKQFEDILNELKSGEERTGIICNVVNDIPIFVHSTIAEYLAVEFICSLLATRGKCKSIWNFILNEMFFTCNKNVLAILDAKVKIDETLTILADQNKKYIFELLLEQSRRTKGEKGGMKTCLCETIRHDLQIFSVLLFSIVEDNLDESNLIDFIEIVKETNIFMLAVKMDFEKIIASIINHVKVIDKSKITLLFEKYEFNLNIDEVSTDELVHELHKHVWTRMGIVPDWVNLSELSGEIYFI